VLRGEDFVLASLQSESFTFVLLSVVRRQPNAVDVLSEITSDGGEPSVPARGMGEMSVPPSTGMPFAITDGDRAATMQIAEMFHVEHFRFFTRYLISL
jgi:hypothetical protein